MQDFAGTVYLVKPMANRTGSWEGKGFQRPGCMAHHAVVLFQRIAKWLPAARDEVEYLAVSRMEFQRGSTPGLVMAIGVGGRPAG